MIARMLIAIVLALLVVPDLAFARPGGGETYVGSSRGSDSSGDADAGEGADNGLAALVWLISLAIRYPIVGLPILLVVIGFVVFSAATNRSNVDWDSLRTPRESPTRDDVGLRSDWDDVKNVLYDSSAAGAGPETTRLDSIARVDPDFSAILFEDFAFRLYAAAHGCRGEHGKLDELAPYLSARARKSLVARAPLGHAVTGVVIGRMRPTRVNVPSLAADPGHMSVVRVTLEFEANYSVGSPTGRRFAIEDWVLQRVISARTRPQVSGRRFPCPNCGAPWRTEAAAGTQKCSSCGEVVDNGRFDWQVVDIRLRQERDNLPALTGEVPERGTSLPTVRDDHFHEEWKGLLRDDPELTDGALDARLHHVYRVVNQAWTDRTVTPARAVLSDGLADYLQYWLDAYDAQGLHNVLEDMRIMRHEPAKLRRDRYFDAVTIRIWGTGKDYVVRSGDGNHVRGSRERERDYSEYWTLIRSAARRGAPRTDGVCGSCGAPLTVTMSGACGHCGTHVTAGEFDWVLSKIEQDDAYQG